MKKIVSQDILEMFDSIASTYDKTNRIISMGMDNKWRQKAITHHQFNNKIKVLDLCCGTGSWSIILAKKLGPLGKLTALDNSLVMLDLCKEKCRQHHLKNVNFIQADVCALPFKNNSFHLVTIGFGLRNISDKDYALSEIYRVLVPGGSLICLDTSQPPKSILGFFMSIYMTFIFPIVGGLFSKNVNAYKWLSSSTKSFYTPIQLKSLLDSAGFINIRFENYNGGLVAAHFAKKPI